MATCEDTCGAKVRPDSPATVSPTAYLATSGAYYCCDCNYSKDGSSSGACERAAPREQGAAGLLALMTTG